MAQILIRPLLSILISMILVASFAAPVLNIRPLSAEASLDSDSGLLTNSGNTLLHQPNMDQAPGGLRIDGTQLNKVIAKSDFGLLRFGSGQMSFNGIPKRTLVYGSGDANALSLNTRVLSYAGSGRPGTPILGYAYSQNPLLQTSGFSLASDAPLQFDNSSLDSAISSSEFNQGRLSGSSIIGADQAASEFQATGSGVKVAIVDTGTDFSNPDVKNSVARDSKGIPIMLDADGQGIVLTRARYIAKTDESTGKLYNYYGNSTTPSENKIPANFTSYVYVNETSGVYLRTSQGSIPVYNSLYPYYGTAILNATASVDWRIGSSSSDFIKSMSGVYRFGVIFQAHNQLGSLTELLVPVLVVDSEKAGVYDTIIPDMRAGWGFFARDVLGSNPNTSKLVPQEIKADFTGQPRIRIGSGNENLVYDYNNDGYPDFSAGTVGARVADVWQVTGKVSQNEFDKGYGGVVHANLLQPMDPNGDYFGVMYDSQGHGTSTAALVSSKGKQGYDVYRNGTDFHLRGMAPDAKIIPVKALWAGDALYGWLYASGFDPDSSTGKWKYTGAHKADVVSNSWGISAFPLLGYGQGYDLLSIYSSLLMAPGLLAKDYPGTLFVISAGNDGIGYGTIGTPNASPFPISVGATTNNVHVGSQGFSNVTRFGGSTLSYDNIADFSSRGPGVFGDPKPELMAVGSYGFTPWIVTYNTVQAKPGNSTKNDAAFTLFGGTSMACPMVAGAAALLIQDIRSHGQNPDPFLVKNVLMSSAKDLGNDPFTQGAGRVDIMSAIRTERGSAGMFEMSTNDTISNIVSQMSKSLQHYNSTFSLIDGGEQLQKKLYAISEPEGRWYAGQLAQGSSTSGELSLTNPSQANAISVRLDSAIEKLISHTEIQNSTRLFQKDVLHSSKEFGYTPNYYNLTKEIGTIPKNADLMVVRLNFPFSEFMNSSETFGDYLRIASVYAYDWNDANHDGNVSYNETEMINRGGSWGTIQDMMISDPASRFSHTPLIGVYPVPTIFSFWRGDRLINATSMNFTLTVDYYQRQLDQSIHLANSGSDNSMFVTVAPQSSMPVHISLVTSNDTLPGNYEGWIRAVEQQSNHTSLLPVSYVVTTKPVVKDVPVVLSPKSTNLRSTMNSALQGRFDISSGQLIESKPSQSASSIYQGNMGLRPNGYVGGPFDMLSRYAAGDWRSYYFAVDDPSINNAALKISWPSNYTSINAMVFGPDGKLVASSVPSGVFSTFAGWASNDWLGTTSVSQGGGFYFSQNYGDNSTVLNVPVNGTGVYSLLLHNTLFSGNADYEPVSVLAKFSTIRPDTSVPEISIQIPAIISSESKANVGIRDDDPGGFYYSIDDSPFSFLNTSNGDIKLDGMHIAEGQHQLFVETTDSVGHTSSLIKTFTVDRTPPSINLYLVYPDGSMKDVSTVGQHTSFVVPGGTQVRWNLTDQNGVFLPYNVTIPGHNSGTTYANLTASIPVTWRTSAVANNSTGQKPVEPFSLTVRDSAENGVSKSLIVELDDKPPVVALVVPSGEIHGNSTIGIKAYDDTKVSSLMLDIGGLKIVNVTGLKQYLLDTSQLPDGNYKLRLIGSDSVGNSAETAKEISVVNFQPVVVQNEIVGIIIGLVAATAAWAGVFVAKRRTLPQSKGEHIQ